jgi:Zn-dependent protease with chaperone function
MLVMSFGGTGSGLMHGDEEEKGLGDHMMQVAVLGVGVAWWCWWWRRKMVVVVVMAMK